MKILRWIAIVVVTLFALATFIGILLPNEYQVTRSIVIDAPVEKIHPQINGLKHWPTWTVWNTDKYPNLKYTFEGPDEGVGCLQSWTDPDNGDGRLEITGSKPEQGIDYKLYFAAFDTTMLGKFRYEKAGEGTKVVWSSTGELGKNPYVRLMLTAMGIENAIGAEYTQGLAKLKGIVEKAD